jgi:acyl-CoA-binding protein
MDLKEQFEKSVAESKKLFQRPDNQTLLQLYSLYKQATEGDINIDSPSNPFDIVAKAKHNAWETLKGKTKEEAMGEYIAIVQKLQS